jgi:hypothetical protein
MAYLPIPSGLQVGVARVSQRHRVASRNGDGACVGELQTEGYVVHAVLGPGGIDGVGNTAGLTRRSRGARVCSTLNNVSMSQDVIEILLADRINN